MMLLFFTIYIFACLWGMKFCTNGNKAYLSKDTTAAIKGIFILLVFFSHFNSYVSLTDTIDLSYRSIVSWFGQTMVTLFLFYSGYGVMESIQKKGSGYVETFPKKRILATLFRFDCAVFLFLIIGLIFGSHFTLPQVVLSMLGWETLGNSNWYIFVILVLYLITYLAFKLIRTKNNLIPVIAITGIVCVLIVFCWRFYIRDLYWYDTALCYVAGMFYSLLKPYIQKFAEKQTVIKRNITWLLTLLLCLGAFLLLKGLGNTPAYLLSNIVFAIIIVLITMRFHIGNPILCWCGNNLFELYILQRIPMIVFKNLGVIEINVYLYFVLCLLFTILLIKPFQYFTTLLWKLLSLK